MADNPYEKIGSVVEQWCEKNLYTQMLVAISIGYEWEPPHEETHLLDFDAEKGELVWDSDWWEGQQHVELVGFTPLYKVRLKGEGEYARTVRHGRWVTKEYMYGDPDVGIGDMWIDRLAEQSDYFAYCSICGKDAGYTAEGELVLSDFCPTCGADMREVDNEPDS